MKRILNEIYKFIDSFTNEHIKFIFDDCEKLTSIPNKIFCNAIEIENGLKMFAQGMRLKAYSQSIIILRQLMEQVCLLEVLSNHTECLDSFNYLSKLKLDYLKYNNEKNKAAKEKLKQRKEEAENLYKNFKSKKSNISINDYLEYGWMLNITDTCGIEKLYELSSFNQIKSWRLLANSIVHNTFSFFQYPNEEKERLIIESVYIVMCLLDSYMFSYYKFTGFKFIIKNIDYRHIFEILAQKLSSNRNSLYYSND